tara:strand:- start:5887 stop:6078 length:192 start_codon:yes stop_codon:yes gene_type:complete
MKYVIRVQTQNNAEGVGLRMILLSIINMFIGIHSINGEHVNLGLGFGPLEMSVTLHRWTRWLP